MNFINYVERPTQSEKDITSQELARLLNIIQEYQPKLVCFVGKKCCQYQLYMPQTNNTIDFGLQTRTIQGIPVFCVPHGSTKGPQTQFDHKLKYYQQPFTYLQSSSSS
ncbi:hypothetical protein BD770DRAFT_403715 [Pilaira anomala]|nr:hypothetical protein BD770DRAFT_403715 [Pilaira anomala]